MNNLTKNLLLWLVIAVVLMSVFNKFNQPSSSVQSINYTKFVRMVDSGQVSNVHIQGRSISGETTDNRHFTTYTPDDPKLVEQLLNKGVTIKALPPQQPSLLLSIFLNFAPVLLLIGFWIFFMRQMQGGGGGRGAMSFGKSKARMLTEDTNKVTFADVAGVEEAKEEVAELVEFLRDPSKFQKLGGTIPKGVLMTGSPGTGKTL